MKTDVENNEWKAEAPYLATLQKENPFRVPEHYFEALSSTISNSVYTEKLKESRDKAGFTVPDQYFQSLKGRILAETTSEEQVSALPKAAGYTTPDQYFQKLQAGILAKTTGQNELKKEVPARASKIIRLWHSNLLKYASAACFILVTAFGLYLNHQNLNKEPTVAEIANEQMLYDIDEQDIIDHIERNAPETQKNTPTHEELETYILNNYSQNDLSSAIN